MAREIKIGDKVAIFATVGKRIEDRVTLHTLTANNPYSKAKLGDRMRFEGDVAAARKAYLTSDNRLFCSLDAGVFVDEELGRVTV
ncbi:hypothetical protein [Mesorhizobium mediterraneum]|uniref:hypothetical protein n=1 Tax=Mesorhizobium mediterraneum TaxID=43617 RepID=UPI001782E7D1|nr:hypothetical protein [Mesorhizobium mediterraneum]